MPQLPFTTVFAFEVNTCLVNHQNTTHTNAGRANNFNLGLKPYPIPGYGNVHEGFLQTYNLIRNDILQSLSIMEHKRNLFIAGHSLGAALATLSSRDIESTTKCRIGAIYTYGSPRVGDDAFVKAFNDHFLRRSFRVANTSDVVTCIPLPIPLAGIVGGYFSHVDTPVDITVQEEDLEANHHMNTYLDVLKEYREHEGFIRRLIARPRTHHWS